MTDRIGPHGPGCKCPIQEHEPTMKCYSFHRGDLSAPGRQVYEFIFGSDKRSEAPGRILVELNTHHPRVVDAMAFMRETFSQVFGDALSAHTKQMMQDLGEDPITTLLKELFGDRMAVFEVKDDDPNLVDLLKGDGRFGSPETKEAPERENEQDVNS